MNLVKTKSFELAINSIGDSKSSKMAIVLPGRLDTKDYPHIISHVKHLAEFGFFALSFDPPGTWESKGDISIYSMTNYLKAINELIEYFGNRQTLLVGHSRGGSMSMLAGTTNQNVSAFASIMSSYTYKPERSHDEELSWKQDGFLIEEREIPNTKEIREYKLPYSFYLDQCQYDMSSKLSECKKPKMFVYGEKDIWVEPELVKKAYTISSDPKELRSVNSDHDYRFKQNIVVEINILIDEFLKKYNL